MVMWAEGAEVRYAGTVWFRKDLLYLQCIQTKSWKFSLQFMINLDTSNCKKKKPFVIN